MLGHDPLSSRPLSDVTAGSAPPTGAIKLFVSNANAPQLAAGLTLFGYGALFLGSVFSSPAPASTTGVGASEYEFGTHAVAIQQAEASKSRIFPSARASAATPQSVPTYIVGRSQDGSYQVAPQLFATAVVAPQPASGSEYQFGSHQAAVYDSQFKGSVWPSARAALVAAASPPKTLFGGPQADPTQIQPKVFGPTPGLQGLVRALLATPPQQSPVQPSAQLTAPLRSAAAIAGPTVTQVFASPQADTTQIQGAVWPSQRTPPVAVANTPRTLFGAPQADRTQIQPVLWGPVSLTVQGNLILGADGAPQDNPEQFASRVFPALRTPAALVQGAVPRLLVTPPQQDTRQLPAQLMAPLRAAILITGPTIRQVFGSPQTDTTQIQGSVLGIAAAIPIPPPPSTASVSEYQFGTHQAAIYNSQFRGAIWPSVQTAQGYLILGADGAPQDNPFQPSAFVFRSARASAAVLGSTVRQFVAPPQVVDLTLQGWIKAAAPVRQAKVPPILRGAPQIADLTVQARLIPVSVRPPVLGPTIRQFVVPAQPNLNSTYSVMWTPSTFSPSAPLPPKVYGPIRIVTASVGLQYNYVQIQQPGV